MKNENDWLQTKIAVVVPCYKVHNHILKVLDDIGSEVCQIYVVDDCCPENTGNLVENYCKDSRVKVIKNPHNLGVGGAVMTGYQAAISDGMEIIVKVDGDGQMDPKLILEFVYPILDGEADYTKGNRFFNLEKILTMPKIRLYGNAILSLMTKLSSGYWNIFDPTNGYTAIHKDVAMRLPFHKISKSYFFETDMLFRLSIIHAVVVDIPMDAKYEEEISNLKVSKVIGEFFFKHLRNFFKRIAYNYYLRNMSLASLELLIGLIMLFSGILLGGYAWLVSIRTGVPTPVGTIMLATLPILMGTQLILAFIGYDIASIPVRAIHKKVNRRHQILTRDQK